MKLILCPYCGDIFNLRLKKMKQCSCGKTKGRYLTISEAEVSKDAVSLAIGNGSFQQAYSAMQSLQKRSFDLAHREDYIEHASLIAWVRPNTGKGNPHTKIIEE